MFIVGLGTATAQHISVGVKAGTSLTNAYSEQNVTSVDVVTHFLPTSRNYIVGPMLEVRLPLGLAVEANVLYHPVDLNISTQVIPRSAVQSSQTVSTWEFPVLGKFRLPFPIVNPYVEAGPSFRRVGGVLDSNWSGKGFVFGAGVEVKILKLRIAPELRYTRWGSDPNTAARIAPLSNQNDAQFLVGFSF